ncbi:PAS domain S-box-containing protein [Pontibacter ummariensis]|uniref:histidine kinase n=1 Tax=Pontibacter ummariensis TaxID=1610492 RepID=A0A239CL58_9BACT|nr:CHASE domain-containing protein [Pontibacter ummariensis]PRY14970.1 PAS domain S-box-containing protein [Pontibacter ummariensis]SNS20458.1 PAS domain S-box-containing protein [Pontibacter ummariensis]
MKFARLALFVRDYFVAVFSFLLIFLLTLFIYSETKKKAEERSERLFVLRAEQATEAIEKRMRDYIQVLSGAKALFIATDTVERQAWQAYYKSLNLEQNYPGILGLGYAHVIYPQELEAHEERIRREGFSDYRVYPEGKRPVYTSIVFLEPFSGSNLRAFGFDMFSEPVRQSAMRIARDTKQPALSGKVRLVQEMGHDEQAGFLIYLPVYKDNASPESILERQTLIEGYVYSPFRAKDLMTSILDNNFDDIDLEVYDDPDLSEASVLYSSDSTLFYHTPSDRRFSKLSTISIGNHTWRIYLTAEPDFGRSADTELPYFILLGGCIMSLLMFFIIWSLSNSRRVNRLKQTITDNATGALFIIDAKGYCTFMNPAAEEMTGYTFEEIQEKPLHDLIHYKHPDGSPFPMADCPIGKALMAKEPLQGQEDVFVRKDGSFFNVSCAVQPIIENGQVGYTIIEVRDITDEKRAQEAIIESEARFRTMADNAPVMIWVGDSWGEFIYVNKQWVDFTGISFEESISLGWRQVLEESTAAQYADVFKKASEEAGSFKMEMRMRRHDGQICWVMNTAMPRYGVNGEFLGHIGSIIDITEIKEAERKVKQNAELIQKLFLEVPAVVALVRAPDYQYVLANPQYRKLYGNRSFVGKSIYEAHSEKEGRGFFKRMEQVFRTGKPFVGNEMPSTINRNGMKAGQQVQAYFNLVYQPLIDGQGNVEAVLIFAVEVTELVNARKELITINKELSDKNAELLRTNNDLDSFVYTASHDLKSPIANMEGLASLLRDILQGKLEQEDMQILDMVQQAVNKLKSTIADLAEITKVQKELQVSVEPLSFDAMLQDIKADINSIVAESGASITADLQVQNILYTRKNLRSIIYNLVSNAIKYKSPERQPVVHIRTRQEGEYIVLEVQDNGLGIKKEQQHKLFTMFKRLHNHVDGTGIGLYIVKRIIENNGGRIEVESELGEGTTFRVYFKQEPVPAPAIQGYGS